MLTATLPRIHLLGLLALTLFIGLFGFFSTDKQFVFLNDPQTCGIYCRMALQYDTLLENRAFDPYYFQKSLPALIAHITLSVTGLPFTAQNANNALEILSILLLIGSAALWYGVCRNAGFSASAFWVGSLGLFLCQLFVKLAPYAQESPDTASFFIGVLTLYAITHNRFTWILPLYALTFFIQPQLKIVLAPIFLLFATQEEKGHSIPILSSLLHLFQKVCAFFEDHPVWAVRIIFASYITIFSAAGYLLPIRWFPTLGFNETVWDLMPLSIVLSSLLLSYLIFTLGIFSVCKKVSGRIPTKSFLVRLVILLMTELILKKTTSLFCQGDVLSMASSFRGASLAYYNFYFQAIEQPLKFMVAHISFYGPIAALIIILWPRILKQLGSTPHDLALRCSFILLVLLLPNSESRHFIAFLPWFTFLALRGLSFKPVYVGLFSLMALAASRFYATYGPVTPEDDPFLMTWGPWFTPHIYAESGAVCVLLLLLTHFFLQGTKKESE